MGIFGKYCCYRVINGIYFTDHILSGTSAFRFFPDIWVWCCFYPLFPYGDKYRHDDRGGSGNRYSASLFQLRRLFFVGFYHIDFYFSAFGRQPPASFQLKILCNIFSELCKFIPYKAFFTTTLFSDHPIAKFIRLNFQSL